MDGIVCASGSGYSLASINPAPFNTNHFFKGEAKKAKRKKIFAFFVFISQGKNMPNWSILPFFITTALILVFMPGPNTLYVVNRSIHQGRKAAIVSSLGIHVCTLVHISAAAFGMSALLLSSALAFNTVKYLGAA